MRKVNSYTLADLLANDDFISFANHPTEEKRIYWNNLIRKGRINHDDYELALDYIKKLSRSSNHLTREEVKDMWLNIRIENNNNKKPVKNYLFLSAIAVAMLITGILLFHPFIRTEAPLIIGGENKIEIENVSKPNQISEDIQVILSDNNRIEVKENNTEIKYNDKGEAEINSQKIEESVDQTTDTQSTTYNQVIIPKGKFSSLILSDGTKLWLNAASRVVYPPVFEKTKREIFIEGEAYIEVTPDEKKPFIVKTKQMHVKVLGTSFNISAYEEEKSQTVVLVSGSVTVKTKNEEKLFETTLSPNQLFTLTGEKAQIQKVNVKNYISWKEGYYIYKSETLSYILNRLSNYYGITIEFDNIVGNMRYSGKMDLKEDIERVFEGLCYTAPIDYQKEKNIHCLRSIPKPQSPMK